MSAIIFHEPVFATIVESGDRLFFYEVSTTTDLTVYLDADLATPAPQPIVADSAGRFPPIYLDSTGNPPKVVLEDSDSVQKWATLEYPIEDTASLAADVAQLQIDVEAVEGDTLTNSEAITALQSDVSDNDTELADHETRIEALEGASAPTGLTAGGYFTGGASPVYQQSFGVTGTVNRTGTGTYVITFSTPRESNKYIVVATAGPQTASSPLECLVKNKATNSFTIETWYLTGGDTRALQDRDVNFMVVDTGE